METYNCFTYIHQMFSVLRKRTFEQVDPTSKNSKFGQTLETQKKSLRLVQKHASYIRKTVLEKHS